MGSGSSKQTVGYKYYLGAHFVVCHGPIDAVTRVRFDERDAWTGENTGTTIAVNKPALFGGDSREGGVVGDIDVDMGDSAQTANSYLSGLLSNVPGFRGVMSLIFNKLYVGNNPYLKSFDIKAQRVNTGYDGSAIWYPATAAIQCGGPAADTVLLVNNFESGDLTDKSCVPCPDAFKDATNTGTGEDGYYQLAIKEEATGNEDGLYYDGGSKWGGLSTCTVELLFDLIDRPAYSLYFFDIDTTISTWGGGVKVFQESGVIKQKTGTTATTFGTARAAGQVNHLAYVWDGLSYAPRMYFNGNYVATLSSTFAKNTSCLLGGFNNTLGLSPSNTVKYHGVRITSDVKYTGTTTYTEPTSFDYPICSTDCLNLNPIHTIRECLLSKTWGMGYNTSDIDDTNFQAAADTIYNEGFGLSFFWSRETSVEEFIKMVLEHIGGSLYVSRTTGKFQISLARDDYTAASLDVYDEDNIVSISNFQRKTVAELTNQVTVIYTDCDTGNDQSVTVQDIALYQQQGATIGTTIEYPGITCANLAEKVAMRDLAALSNPLASCTVYLDRSASGLNVGDVFKLSWSKLNLSEVIMRVTNVELGDIGDNVIKVDCVEDVFAFGASAYSTGTSEWTPPGGDPIATTYDFVVEAPYYEIARDIGDDDAQALASDAGFVYATAVRTSGIVFNALLYSGDTTVSPITYTETGVVDFCPTALLDGAMAKAAGPTTASIDNGVDLDGVDVGSLAVINGEWMRVDAISSSSVTLGRGCLDTVPVAHADNSRIYFVQNYAGSDNIEYADSDTGYFKLCPVATAGALDVADASANTVTFDSRQNRPYPPGQFKINGSYYPSQLTALSDIVVTWVHRDRLQQTTPTIYDTTDASIGPEASTTYTVELHDLTASPTLIASQSGITGTTHTFSNPGASPTDMPGVTSRNLTVYLKSVRGGVESWQTHAHTFYYPTTEAFLTADSPNAQLVTADSPNQDFHVEL